MTESKWVVQVLEENDTTASAEPFLALIAARVPFDLNAKTRTGPVIVVVRTGSDRDRMVLDLSRLSAPQWTGMVGIRERPESPVIRVRAEDLSEDPSKVRVEWLEVDWEAADLQYVVLWRADPKTAAFGPPGGPDAAELFSFLSTRFPMFHSIESTGGFGTRGGSNILWDAVGIR